MDTNVLLARVLNKEFEESRCVFKVKDILAQPGEQLKAGSPLMTVIKEKTVKRGDEQEVVISENEIEFTDKSCGFFSINEWNIGVGDVLEGSVEIFSYSVEENFGNLIYKMVENFSKKRSDLHYSQGIPEKKLGNALKAYGGNVEKDRAVYLYDDTFFGSAKEGFLITDSSIACKGTLDNFKFRFVDYISSKVAVVKIKENDEVVEETRLNIFLKGDDEEKTITLVEDQSIVKIHQFKEFLDCVKGYSESGHVKETDGYVIIEDLPEAIKLYYIKSLIIFTYLDDQEIDSAEVSEIQVLMTQLNFTAELRYQVRELMTNAHDFSLKVTLSELMTGVASGSEQAVSVSLLKDTIRVHSSTKESRSLDSPIIQEMATILGVNKEQLEFIDEAYQNDKKILSGEISDDMLVANAKELASKAGAVGVPIAAIYLSGSAVGLSAAGVTSGLAALGLGGVLGLSSMVSGIGAAIILGVGIYKGLQWALGSKERDKASRREFMLQDVLRVHQKAISNLAEDVNYFAEQLVEAVADVAANGLRIQKLSKHLTMYGNVIKSLKANEAMYEESLKEETEKRAA
jgi:hypothetical protein